MTPQEKAKELVDKMRDEIPCHCDDWEQAKQCALIAVDTVLWMASHYATIDYWNEVKKEIEKI